MEVTYKTAWITFKLLKDSLLYFQSTDTTYQCHHIEKEIIKCKKNWFQRKTMNLMPQGDLIEKKTFNKEYKKDRL